MPEETTTETPIANGQGEAGEGATTPENSTPAAGQEGQPAEGAGNSPQGDDEPQIKQRKTVKDFIIERQARKIAKLKGQGAAGEDDQEEAGENLEDKKFVIDTVEPLLEPFITKSLQAEDEQEVQSFLTKNPDFKPYEAKARKFMQHPSRRELPIESIFYEVAGPDLMKLGANRAKQADDEAKRGTTGGGTSRDAGGSKSAWDMSDGEFAAQKEAVRQRR